MFAVTDFGTTVNVAVELPAVMMTEAEIGTMVGFELVKVTLAPPVAAGPVKLTVPVRDPVPPLMLDELSENDLRVAALTDTDVVALEVPIVAVRVTALSEVTG